jgi:hypothetical protein
MGICATFTVISGIRVASEVVTRWRHNTQRVDTKQSIFGLSVRYKSSSLDSVSVAGSPNLILVCS